MIYNPLKVVEIAKAEIGYLEKKKVFLDCNAILDDKISGAGSDNITKYWRDLSKAYQGQPWCNAFVNWCFIQAYGLNTARTLLYTSGPWSYYTPTSASYFKKNGAWFTEPNVGDLIYFKNSTRICHVGIVIGIDKYNVYTVEGNTSDKKGVVPNGGTVASKTYKLNYRNIAGYGRPKFMEQGIQPVTVRKPTIGLGSTGEYVKLLHKKLREHKYGVSENNDKFDELTEQCVRHYQKVNNLEVDGIVGKETWTSLDK